MVAATEEEVIRFGMSWSERERLGLTGRLLEIEREMLNPSGGHKGVYADWWEDEGRNRVIGR